MLSTTELWQLLESYASSWKKEQQQQGQDHSIDGLPANEGKGSLSVELDDPTNTSSHKTRKTLIRKSFRHVFEYLSSVEPDTADKIDELETMFRSDVSAHAEKFLAAVEKNASSGGVAEYLFKYAAERLCGLNLWQAELKYCPGRNPDYADIDLHSVLREAFVDDKEELSRRLEKTPNLKFARAYGFRNIQSLLQKMKRGTCDLDLVEVMACPSGCNNGGGQLKGLTSLSSSEAFSGRGESPAEGKERVQAVEDLFIGSLAYRKPEDNPLAHFLYDVTALSSVSVSNDRRRAVLGGAPLCDAAREYLHTRYHAVPKLEVIAPLAAKW